jgi:hypothetical protein
MQSFETCRNQMPLLMNEQTLIFAVLPSIMFLLIALGVWINRIK